MKNNGFTLIEIMVGITIISVITFGIINLYSNNNSDKQKLNIFTNKLIGKIDTAKNYSLVGKGIGTTLETPSYFKIEISTGNYLRTYFNTGASDIVYDQLSLNPFENFYEIKSIECKNLDLTNISSTGSINIFYEGTNITLSGCSDNYQKVVDLELYYKGLSNNLRLNTISGVLEKIN